MSFSRIVRVLVLLGVIAVFVPSGSATPARQLSPASHVQPGQYTGPTSQPPNTMFMNVVEGGDNDYMDQFAFGFSLTCGKSGRTVGVGMGFGGFHVDIDPTNHTFRFAFGPPEALQFYFKFQGQFTSDTTATGTAITRWAALVSPKHAEICDSDHVTWTATHTLSKEQAQQYDYFFQVTKQPDGSVTITQTK